MVESKCMNNKVTLQEFDKNVRLNIFAGQGRVTFVTPKIMIAQFTNFPNVWSFNNLFSLPYLLPY